MSGGKGLNLNLGEWLETSAVLPSATKAADAGEVAPASVLEWAARYRRPESRRFTLNRFKPLQTLYEDDHPHICVIKPAQRGVSEYAVNMTLFAMLHGASRWRTQKDGLNIGYLFPTQSALTDFSKERLSGLANESPLLADMLRSKDGFGGVTFRQIGNSYLYMRGAWSESSLLSFAADMLILDEYDRMDPKAVALARRRMNASPLRREVDISTPTIPGKGIHALYLQSDRQQYRQECPHCGEMVVLNFFNDVRAGDEPFDEWQNWEPQQIRERGVTLHCPACKREWDDDARCQAGVWTPEQPQVRALRGYHMPSLAFPMADIERFAVAATSTDPHEQTEFYRSDLGMPYDASGSRITAVMLAQLGAELPGGELPVISKWRDTTMGVDVGARFHYRISSTGPNGERYVRAMGSVHSWTDLSALMVRYQVRRCVIDALPELHACREWAGKWFGRVLRAFYPNANALSGILMRPDDDKGTVQINRTMALDGVLSAVAGAQEHWPLSIAKAPEVISHLGAPVRVVVEDDYGQPRATWAHTTPDHLFHACAYDQVALATLAAYREGMRLPVFAQGAATGWNA